MQNRFIDLTDDEYFSYDALSNSFLKEFSRSPAHAFVKKTSAAFDEGTAIHRYILEPERFDKYYMIVEKIDKRTKEGKELVEKAELENKIILTQSDVSRFEKMKQSVYSRIFELETLEEIIKKGKKEKAVLFECYDYQFKAKFDLLYNNVIFDLKTTDNAKDFKKSVNNYKYYRQDYLYSKALDEIVNDKARFIFIAIEKQDPFGCMLYELTYDYRMQAEREIISDLTKYSRWLKNGADKSEAYENELSFLNCPNWLGGNNDGY